MARINCQRQINAATKIGSGLVNMTSYSGDRFLQRVACHVERLLDKGPMGFQEILRGSLNCDPAVLRRVLGELEAAKQLERTRDGGYSRTARDPFRAASQRSARRRETRGGSFLNEVVTALKGVLPDPCPVYSQWWFARQTYFDLSRFLLTLAPGRCSAYAFLGASTLGAVFSYVVRSQVVVLDADQVLLDALQKHVAPNAELVPYEVSDRLPVKLTGAYPVVFADPPWGRSVLRTFLLRGLQLVKCGGWLAISFPPLLTRPAIEQERAELIELAAKCGFRVCKYLPGFTRYTVPPFERNAYQAAGITLDGIWRSGDVFLFQRVKDQAYDEAPAFKSNNWEQFRKGRARLFLKRDGHEEFGTPSIVPVPGMGDFKYASTSTRSPEWDRASIVSTTNYIGQAFGRRELSRSLVDVLAADQPQTEAGGLSQIVHRLIEV